MHHRPLGRTGLRVSAIGFGAWGIGGHTPGGRSYGATDDDASVAALEAAFEAGVTFYDTAPLYGLGHSEILLGRTFRTRRDRVVIATKAGYADFSSPPDHTAAALRRSLEASLRRLGTDHVDLLQLHDAGPDDLSRHPQTIEELHRLRAEGKIRAFGASVKRPEHALALVADWGFPVIQVNFNLLDLRVLECGLMELAGRLGTGLIARTPLCFGFLTGRLSGEETFAPDDHRSLWPRHQLRAWAGGARRLLAAADPDDPGSSAALRFVLSFPAVSTTIPGMLTPREVAENTAAGHAGPLPAGTLAAVLRMAGNGGP